MVDVTEIRSQEEMQKAFNVRRIVFCDEQKVDPQVEFDGLDLKCRHYLAVQSGRAIGTARLRIDHQKKKFKIERVAVLLKERGKGAGQALMRRAINDAQPKKGFTIAIHAQCHALSFYETLGFKKFGDEFEEAGISHFYMEYINSPCVTENAP